MLTFFGSSGRPTHSMLQDVDCTWSSKDGFYPLNKGISDPVTYATNRRYMKEAGAYYRCYSKGAEAWYHGNCSDTYVVMGPGKAEILKCCARGSGPLHCCPEFKFYGCGY